MGGQERRLNRVKTAVAGACGFLMTVGALLVWTPLGELCAACLAALAGAPGALPVGLAVGLVWGVAELNRARQ